VVLTPWYTDPLPWAFATMQVLAIKLRVDEGKGHNTWKIVSAYVVGILQRVDYCTESETGTLLRCRTREGEQVVSMRYAARGKEG
jgi:hypothetical protein